MKGILPIIKRTKRMFYNFNFFEILALKYIPPHFSHQKVRNHVSIDHIPTYTEYLTWKWFKNQRISERERSSTMLYISSTQHFSFRPLLKQSKELKGRNRSSKSIQPIATASLFSISYLINGNEAIKIASLSRETTHVSAQHGLLFLIIQRFHY